MQRCGYVALVGKPNAGKSTLFNAIVGQKLAGVSRKPQTTRNRILGVVTDGSAQFLFLDSPGVHSLQNAYLNKAMNSVTGQVITEASVIVYIVDINRGIDPEDRQTLERILRDSNASLMFLYSQADRLAKIDRKRIETVKIQEFMELLEAPEFSLMKNRLIEPEPRIFSAKNKEMIKSLLAALRSGLPESVFLYPEEDITDRSEKFIVAEMIREQVFRCLGKEVPYEAAVIVSEMIDKGNLLNCHGEIILARESHKPIVIGKKGAKIKEIGVQSRSSLEQYFDKKVYLDLSVRVERNWINERDHVENLAHLIELSLD
jgi:GTP-binding protein Era